MCIRDRVDEGLKKLFELGDQQPVGEGDRGLRGQRFGQTLVCLLYTSDAADERSSVDLGGRRIIKKKKKSSLGEATQDSISTR